MSERVPFAARRDATVARAVEILSADARFPAGWLEGSLADGSADPFSDIDLHLAVVVFVRAKLLAPGQAAECARLIDRILAANGRDDRAAMRDLHIEIFRRICSLARSAFERYGLTFPPRVEDEMAAFYAREWPPAASR